MMKNSFFWSKKYISFTEFWQEKENRLVWRERGKERECWPHFLNSISLLFSLSSVLLFWVTNFETVKSHVIRFRSLNKWNIPKIQSRLFSFHAFVNIFQKTVAMFNQPCSVLKALGTESEQLSRAIQHSNKVGLHPRFSKTPERERCPNHT